MKSLGCDWRLWGWRFGSGMPGRGAGRPKARVPESQPAGEQRAADLVHRMTLEEKATQLVNQARAIPRLNVPAYDWWSESLHGVRSERDHRIPRARGVSGQLRRSRDSHHGRCHWRRGTHQACAAVRAGHSDIFEGLDFWAPNVNIFRDPRWAAAGDVRRRSFPDGAHGRCVCDRHAGDDPHYYRVISTPKHFAVHSGPESTRHQADVTVSKHDELDTICRRFAPR